MHWTTRDFATLLARHGVVHYSAVEDPDGYDGGVTLEAISTVARELRHWLAKPDEQTQALQFDAATALSCELCGRPRGVRECCPVLAMAMGPKKTTDTACAGAVGVRYWG